MAIKNRLGSFALIGIKDLVAKDRSTKAVEAKLSHLVSINISDELSTDYLRGGYTNPKLLTIYGDRDTTLTATSATMSTDLLKILTNSNTVVKPKSEQMIEDLEISRGAFTISADITAGVAPTIFALDQFGKEIKPALAVGTPDSNEGDYSISDKVITCHSSVTKIRVYYESMVEVETIEIADVTPRNFEFSGLAVAKEIESGKLYKVWIEIPNGSITPSYNIGGKNEASAPDSVELTIDCLQDTSKGYPIAISFLEDK